MHPSAPKIKPVGIEPAMIIIAIALDDSFFSLAPIAIPAIRQITKTNHAKNLKSELRP
jgi:hypothetical protein